MELGCIVLNKISQLEKNAIWFHSYVEFKKQNDEHKAEKEKLIKINTERETNHKRLWTIKNKLRVAGGAVGGGWAKWGMGIKEGTRDAHCYMEVMNL